jgi:3-hydroxypropanoate dehydrogenase
MTKPIDKAALDQLFLTARTQNGFTSEPIDDSVLHQLYDLLKMGPTSANCSPARFVFVKSHAAKEQLKPALSPSNIDKTMSAPVTVIIGQDMEFYEKLPQLFPQVDAKSWFVGDPDNIKATAARNSSLQGAYLILAARALGLDCGPMSGFDANKVNDAFFNGTTVTANFLVNIGHGDASKLFDRNPRLSFDEAAKIV